MGSQETDFIEVEKKVFEPGSLTAYCRECGEKLQTSKATGKFSLKTGEKEFVYTYYCPKHPESSYPENVLNHLIS